MSNDIRDILAIDRSDNIPPIKKKKNVARSSRGPKRPEGMAREVFALLYNDSKDLPPLIPTDTDQSYKHTKAKLGMRKAKQWRWMPFTNPARTDGAIFYQWKRVTDSNQEYPFAKFNVKIEVVRYTDEEYEKYFKSDNWSREETDYFLDLCEKYDLRFIVIQDRYDEVKYKPRSVEDLKERYYQIKNKLHKVRHVPGTSYSEPKAYDADHERRRKIQLVKLMSRTREQCREERKLIQELEKIEARKRDREKKAQELQKLIGGNFLTPELGPGRKQDKKTGSGRKRGQAAAKSKEPVNVNNSEGTGGIKFPELKNPGPYLRSSFMRLPSNTSQKRLKLLEQYLKDLNVDLDVIPTEQTVKLFNSLRNKIIILNEFRSNLEAAVYEALSLKHQYQAANPGQSLVIPDIINPEKNPGGI